MAPARRREWRSISGSNRWAPATAGSHDHHHHAQTFVGGVSGTRVVEADAHAGHGAHMVRDMLRRFVGSAILTVPVVLYSPLGTSLFGREPGWTAQPRGCERKPRPHSTWRRSMTAGGLRSASTGPPRSPSSPDGWRRNS